MPAEMWLPLVINIVGVYCLLGANVLSRLRLEILRREQGTQWVRELVVSGSA